MAEKVFIGGEARFIKNPAAQWMGARRHKKQIQKLGAEAYRKEQSEKGKKGAAARWAGHTAKRPTYIRNWRVKDGVKRVLESSYLPKKIVKGRPIKKYDLEGNVVKDEKLSTS
jgi:hypothetical protein